MPKHRYVVKYSWPSNYERGGVIYPTTAHGGFVGDFNQPVTEADWPALAQIIENDQPARGPVTITSVTPSADPRV